MLNKIKVNVEKMNWLSLSILKFGLMLSCSLLLIGVIFQNSGFQSSIYNLPINMGQVAVAIFSEAFLGSLFIDYYVKKHGDQQEQ